MTQIVVQGEVRLDPADMGAFRAIAPAFIAANRGEDGCLHYSLAQDLEEPGLVHIAERWRDGAALAAHRQAAHVASFTAELMKLRVLGLRIVDYDAADARLAMGQ